MTALVATPSASPTPSATQTATVTPVPCLDSYESDGEPAAARPLVLGEKQVHLFCPAGDADWVTFFGKAGKGYQLETTNLDAGADTYVYLFAPDGHTLLAQNDDEPAGHGPSALLWIPPLDGWYFLQVKNQGDIGYPGLGYTLDLTLLDAPTATLEPLAGTSLPASPGATPIASPTQALTAAPPTVTSPAPSTPPVSASTAMPDLLLQPQVGGAETGGMPVFQAGRADGLTPDWLEPNDRFEAAYPLNVGAIYQHLNFVPTLPGTADEDFYSFRTKPGNCYALTTGDLAAGLDTTILLWATAPTREGRQLVAQNDDSHPHTPDLSSYIRWCNPPTGPDDRWLVAQIRNYGRTPGPDPRGKTYSLIVQIDPPTPTPTATPRPSSPPLPSGSGGTGGVGGLGGITGSPGLVPAFASPTTGFITPDPSSAPPTASPPAIPIVTATPVHSLTLVTVTSAAGVSPTPPPTATPVPVWVRVDVVAYVVPNLSDAGGGSDGPQPGDGIQGLTVLLIDAPTNAVLQTATTDANGHAALRWPWTSPVRVALPAFRWSRPVTRDDLERAGDTLYLEARTPGYPLPGIFP
jgi:hypothetical protein